MRATLFIALPLYLVGTAAAVYARPAAMFRPDGTWKEFGVEGEGDRTPTPFYLFAVAWALLSYAVAVALTSAAATAALTSSMALPAAAAAAATAAGGGAWGGGATIAQPVSSRLPPSLRP